MDIALQLEFRIKITGQEFRLISLALSGNLKKQEFHEARQLSRRMLEMRIAYVKQALETADGALTSLLMEEQGVLESQKGVI
jgi:hypothetical protein